MITVLTKRQYIVGIVMSFAKRLKNLDTVLVKTFEEFVSMKLYVSLLKRN